MKCIAASDGDNNTTDDAPLPERHVSFEIHQHGHSVVLRWKNRGPTYRDARQMAEILYREADRLTNALGG